MSVFHNIYQTKIKEKQEEAKKASENRLFTVYNNYVSTVTNTFSWGNLPKNILHFLPEEFLFYWGMIAFFKDDDGNFAMYPCFPNGKLLDNGEYDTYTIIAKNGKQWVRSRDSIELCYNNSMRIPSSILVEEFVNNTSLAFNAVNTALERAMIPPILNAQDEAQMQTILDVYQKNKNNLPFRVSFSESLVNGDIKISKWFDNRESDILALWDVYTRNRNNFYTTFGVNVVEIQKKERLTEAEGSGNDEITRYTILKNMYDCRKDFIARVHNSFNYELSLEINRDIRTVYEISVGNREKMDDFNIQISKGANLPKDFESKTEEKDDEN